MCTCHIAHARFGTGRTGASKAEGMLHFADGDHDATRIEAGHVAE